MTEQELRAIEAGDVSGFWDHQAVRVALVAEVRRLQADVVRLTGEARAQASQAFQAGFDVGLNATDKFSDPHSGR
jgi:hypothetical protein